MAPAGDKEKLPLKEGERRVVSILFSDMKGSTSISERLDPEEMDALMGSVFSRYEAIIAKHGGHVEKYIGDALVAVFGYPELHDDDPARAISAALEFIDEERAINEGLKSKGIRVSFRSGINTGLITTGRRGDYEVVTGHAMNIAQRLESEAPPDSVYVTQSTKEAAEGSFVFSRPLVLKAKATSQPIHAYQVIGRAGPEALDQGPFIGRARYLEAMLKDYMRFQGEGGAWIYGEAGAGKTRLALAFLDKARAFPDFKAPVMSARAQRFRAQPFSLIVDLVLDYFDLTGQSDPEPASFLLAQRTGASSRACETFARLAFRLEGAPDAEAFEALASLMGAALDAARDSIYAPIVFVDEAQAMDAKSAELLRFMARREGPRPFLIFASRHPPASPSSFPGIRVERLEPMGPEEAKALLDCEWPPPRPDGADELVLGAAGGRPLFIKEYARYAKSAKDLRSMPSGAQAILLSALDGYGQRAKELLTIASAFIHSFSAANIETIAAKTGIQADGVVAVLADLCSKGVLSCEGGLYSFRHELLKRAIYDSILNHNKRILHGIIADIVSAQANPHRTRLIHHLCRAERYSEAIEALKADPGKTGNPDYLPYIDELLSKVNRDIDSEWSLLSTKSAILFNAGKVEESEQVLKRLLEIAVGRNEDSYLAFSYHLICAMNVISYSFRKAYFNGLKAEAHYKRAGRAGPSLQNVYHNMAVSETLARRFESAKELLARAEALEGVDAKLNLSARAEHLLLASRYSEAAGIAEGLIETGAEIAKPDYYTGSLALRARLELCDAPRAIALADMVLAAPSLKASNASQAASFKAIALAMAGRGAEAAPSMRQAEFFAGQVMNDLDRTDSLRSLSYALAALGMEERARDEATKALALAIRHSDFYIAFCLLTLLAELALGRGAKAEAESFLFEAQAYCEGPGPLPLVPRKEEALYASMRAELACDAAERERYEGRARELFSLELEEIAEKDRVEALLRYRSFGRRARGLGLL
jgi:class 3 adenylate cyclase